MKTHHLLAAALLAIGASVSHAAEQMQVSNANGNPLEVNVKSKPLLWQATLSDSAKVVLAVPSITSVSMHPYLVNGTALVTEVTVDTVGNNTIRFYYMHAEDSLTGSTPARSALGTARKSVAQAIGGQKDEGEIPSVKFPEGTYGHSIEYQVSSQEDLEKIYKSLLASLRKISASADTLKLDGKDDKSSKNSKDK